MAFGVPVALISPELPVLQAHVLDPHVQAPRCPENRKSMQRAVMNLQYVDINVDMSLSDFRVSRDFSCFDFFLPTQLL